MNAPVRRWYDSSLLTAVLILAAVVACHSPRWWLIVHPTPGSFEWDRAAVYLQQCANPWRDDLTAAVRWRFLPQVLVWLVHGGPALALAFPWFGALAFTAYCHHVLRRQTADSLAAAAATVVLAASGPVLVSTGWLGLNDAWFALALCYVAFGRNRGVIAAACVLGTFVDERFVFGLPLAIWLRAMAAADDDFGRTFTRAATWLLPALAPFVVSRLIGAALGRDAGRDQAFLSSSLHDSAAYLWCAPLGAWMALRFACFPAAERLAACARTHRTTALALLLTAAGPVLAGFLLASDTLRTAGIVLPLCLWGAAGLAARKSHAYWLGLAAASLLVPAAHVTYTKIMPINSLPLELMRLWR